MSTSLQAFPPALGSLVEKPGNAATDLKAIVAWVGSKRGSTHTRRAFGFEARRWLAWLIWAKSGQYHHTWLDKATSLDAAAYTEFLQASKNLSFPVEILDAAALERQPFKSSPLKAASVERAISVLKTMYADMMEMTLEDGLQINRSPFARFKIKQTIADKGSPRSKALLAAERRYINEAIEQIRQSGAMVEYHQLKWIWTALLWAALRRHELAKAVAGDIYLEQPTNGPAVWMLDVVGKGNSSDSVPLSDEFIKGLKEYRDFHSLPTSSSKNVNAAQIPLVIPMRGEIRNVHPETINRAVKKLLEIAAAIALKNDDTDSANRLQSFASHSARHTQVTMIVDETGDITLGQQIARHKSIMTTQRYKARSIERLVQALGNVGKKEAVK